MTTSIRIRNLIRIQDHLADRLWHEHPTLLTDPAAQAHLRAEIERHATTVERLCHKHASAPANFHRPSRHAYCWLKFLAAEDNLAVHLQALATAKRILADLPTPPPLPIRLHLISMETLWRKRAIPAATAATAATAIASTSANPATPGAIHLTVSQGFIAADSTVWRALLHGALSRRSARRTRLVHTFAESDEYAEALCEVEAFASPTAVTRGRVHDLAHSFDRVNHHYFAGQMARPSLGWNAVPAKRKFAHYQPCRDLVLYSPFLDDPRVPEFVLDFVTYHELLHKKHGARFSAKRRLVHTTAFRADERRFLHYAEADRLLTTLARRRR